MLIQDIRYALRSFLRAPGFTLVALLTLALGIGGTTAIFSIVDGVVLRPLPYSNPERILRSIGRRHRPGDDFLLGRRLPRPEEGRDVAFGDRRLPIGRRRLDGPRRTDPRHRTQTTAAFFDVFDAPPLLGRTYHEATDKPGAAVAVIGEAIWRQQFGRDPA